MFKNLKVRSKLLVSFGIVIIFYIIAIIASSIGLGSVFGGLEDFYNIPFPMVKSALEAQSITREIQLDVYRAVSVSGSELQAVILKGTGKEIALEIASFDNDPYEAIGEIDMNQVIHMEIEIEEE